MVRINRRQYLKGVAGTTTAASIGIAGCLGGNGGESELVEANGDTVELTYGGGGSGTLTNNTGQAMQLILDENSDMVDITVQETGGTQANQRLYDQGEVDFIGGSNYAYIHGERDTGPWEDEPIELLPHQGFTYGLIHNYFLAVEGSGLETWDDFAGEDVWPLFPASTTRFPLIETLEETGMMDEINEVEVSQNEIAGAIEEGRVTVFGNNAVNYQGLVGWAQEIDARVDAEIIPMGDAHRQAAQDLEMVGYEEIEPYGWEQDVGDFDTIGSTPMEFQIMFGDHLSDEIVYEIVSTLAENQDTMEEVVGVALDFSDPEILSQVMMDGQPIHPGIAEYYQETGVWDDNWSEGELL